MFRSSLIAVALSVLAFTSSHANAAVITYTLENLAPSGAPGVDTFTGTGYVGPRRIQDPNGGGFGRWFHIERNGPNYEDNFSRVMAQVDISALAGAMVQSATLSYIVNDGDIAARLTSFSATGTLGFSFPDAPDDLGSVDYTSLGSQVINSVSVGSLLQDRIDAGASWFGMYLSPTENGGQALATNIDADAAMVRLTVQFESSGVPAPGALALLTLGLIGLSLRRGTS